MPLLPAPGSGEPFEHRRPRKQRRNGLAAYRVVYAPALAAGARCFEFSQTPLDRLGLPLWTVACVDADGALSDGFGYGPTLAAAQASAWGEAVEWHLGPRVVSPRVAHPGHVFRPCVRLGGPCSIPCRSASPLAAATRTTTPPWNGWKPAAIPRKNLCWCPWNSWRARFADLGPGFDRAAALAVPITNGLGAGLTQSPTRSRTASWNCCNATATACITARWTGGCSLTSARTSSRCATPRTRALLQTLDAAGIEILVKLADDSFGLANLYVVGYDRDPTLAPQAVSLSACGEAAASRPRTRAGQSPARIRVRPRPERHSTTGRSRRFGRRPRRATWRRLARRRCAVRTTAPCARCNAGCGWTTPLTSRKSATRFSTRAPGLRFDELPTMAVPDSGALLALLTERLAQAGLEIYCVDFTPPGSSVVALKAIVPGLEVETMTYQRIGARNLRRLLARGSPLVGVGAGPASGGGLADPPCARRRGDFRRRTVVRSRRAGSHRRPALSPVPRTGPPCGRHPRRTSPVQPLISFPPCASAFSPAVTFPPSPG